MEKNMKTIMETPLGIPSPRPLRTSTKMMGTPRAHRRKNGAYGAIWELFLPYKIESQGETP